MKWSIHPLKENPQKGISLILFLFILTIVVFLNFPNIIFTLAAMILVVISLRGFLFKTEYRLVDNYINVKMLIFKYKKEISQFKKYYIDEKGLLLSPFLHKTRLNRYRGVYIQIPKDMKNEIELFIKDKIGNER